MDGRPTCRGTLGAKKERTTSLMKFYSVQTRQEIEVPDDKIEHVTMKNGKKAAKATVEHEGKTLKLFKFLPADKK
jgi:hypothetical protein